MCCDNYVPQWWVEFDDELSWLSLKDSELFILFEGNSQILLKISVIPILLTFIYLVALSLLVNNQLNSLFNSTHHWPHKCHISHFSPQYDTNEPNLIKKPGNPGYNIGEPIRGFHNETREESAPKIW